MKENRRKALSRHDRELLAEQIRVEHSGNPTMALIAGVGLGAGIMYVLDPDRGNRRRAMAQQKLFRIVRQAGDAVDKGIRDLEHRVEGIFAEAASVVRREEIPDDIIVQRVRSKLGRVTSHPSAVEVRAQGGKVILSGPVLRGEKVELEHCVARIRGVHDVESRLEEHDSSENVPGLQGHTVRTGDRPEILQENWAPGTRLVMGFVGLSLLGRSIRQPGMMNTALGVAGLALLARSGRRSRLVGTVVGALRPQRGARAGSRGQHGSRRAEAERRRAAEISGLLAAREIPREQWKDTLELLAEALEGTRVSVEVQDGDNRRIQQRDMPLDGIGADVKDNECTVNITVGRDAATQVTHSIRARGVRLRDEGNGKLLEVESMSGPKTILHFRGSDIRAA